VSGSLLGDTPSLLQPCGEPIRRYGEGEPLRGRSRLHPREVERIPSTVEPSRVELGRIPHREQQRTDGFPGGHRLARLDPAHGSLRRTRAASEGALADTKPNAQVMYKSPRIVDI
jgi:hypothetical protein